MNTVPNDSPDSTGFSGISNEELISLLRSWDRNGRSGLDHSRLREEIVRRNIGLVKSIAAGFLNSGEPLDDLIQAGYIGLLNAVENFDLAKGTGFSTYASYLIQGEIRHYIRDKHTTIRVPEWVQTMNRRITRAEEEFFQVEGRPPTLAELAESLNLDEDRLAAILRGREAMTYVSIDKGRRQGDPRPDPPRLEDVLSDPPGLPDDVRIRILVAIERLTEIQQRIIHGLFYQGKSQSELGRDIGLSQRQISRLKERILREIGDGLLRTREGEELDRDDLGNNEGGGTSERT